MQYVIRQKYFAVRDHFFVEYPNGQPAFQIRGRFTFMAKKFYVCTPDGQEIFYVKQRLLKLAPFPTFDVYQGGKKVARFRTALSFAVKRGKIKGDYGKYKVKGSITSWDFRAEDESGRVVMEMSKKLLRIADTYSVLIDGANDAFMMAIVVILDLLYHPHK